MIGSLHHKLCRIERHEFDSACLGGTLYFSLPYDSNDACSEPISFTLNSFVSFMRISFMSDASKPRSSSDGKDRPDLKAADVVLGEPFAKPFVGLLY